MRVVIAYLRIMSVQGVDVRVAEGIGHHLHPNLASLRGRDLK